MHRNVALAGGAVLALLASGKRSMGGRAALPRAHVGAVTRAGHVDQFFVAWPPQSQAQTMTARVRYACSKQILLTAISNVEGIWPKPDECKQP